MFEVGLIFIRVKEGVLSLGQWSEDVGRDLPMEACSKFLSTIPPLLNNESTQLHHDSTKQTILTISG